MRHEEKKPKKKIKTKIQNQNQAKKKKIIKKKNRGYLLATRLVLAVLWRREYGLCLSMVAICFPNISILMLVWCIWCVWCISVCVSGSDLPPFHVG